MQRQAFVDRCAILDLEVGADGRIHECGALWSGRELYARNEGSSEDLVRRLDAFIEGAQAIVGHNIVAHDRAFLARHLPGARLLELPLIDTLYLAPLARPQRPYHALVKDYKLVNAEKSNPVGDCRLTLELLEDCCAEFLARKALHAGLLSVYRSCFDDSDAPGGTSHLRLSGTGGLLERLGGRSLSRDEVVRGFAHFAAAGNRACPAAISERIPAYFDDVATRPVVAYALAWLQVAGTESVLPRWVQRTFPGALALLRALRSTPCGDSACRYCSLHHDPVTKLKDYFGFEGFRAQPATADGDGLQERIVTRGIAGQPLLAILPTGGGKSLCYQLPAIVNSERTGALTIVISPLQALMKDQVENLNRKTESVALAAALNGLLTMAERHDVLEGVRLGRFALLYVSPEQLRSATFTTAIRQREIATWVFDEAHCISKWGHDFRTDYWYAARYIREFSQREGIEAAPVACFTATAKQDVREEIVGHFRRELGQDLDVLASDQVDRSNLRYGVEEVLDARKPARIDELLREHLGDPTGADLRGSAIVYAAKRKRTEELSDTLRLRGWDAHHFHAGLDPPEKKRVQDAFVGGDVPVIVATNAFGMGIDKDDVRLVVHADAPGSIENYLQEAGRAGRDGDPAHCVLLFAKGDIETQFDLAARNQLEQRDIAQILRAIRKARKKGADEIVVSPGELLRVPETDVSFRERERSASTKVKTAIAWLERAEFVLRNENRTRVFQGVPVVRDMDAARAQIDRLDLPEWKKQRWLEILEVMLHQGDREGLDADDLAHLPSFSRMQSKVGEDSWKKDRTASREIVRALFDMARAKLIDQGIYLTAFVRNKTVDRSLDRLGEILRVEHSIVAGLREAHPDLVPGEQISLAVPLIQERLRADGTPVAADSVRKLVGGWAREGARQHSIAAVKSGGQRGLRATFSVDWDGVDAELALRRDVARVVLLTLLDSADRQALVGEVLIRFSLEEVRTAIEGQLGLRQRIGDPFDAIEKALLFLNEHHVITLQKGLAIFRQAMTIKMPESAKGRSYSSKHYQPLKQHYDQRVFQIHAMGRYVEEAQNGLDRGRRYVQRYFSEGVREFATTYFHENPEVLQRATSRESYEAVVTSLGHPVQEEIVTSPTDQNLLVLAGPGAGKTRVVVHRCAYLLRVERVRPESVLVVCFNRHAMHELRTRLRDLVGNLSKSIAVHTYHSLALRLTERSLAVRVHAAGEQRVNFDEILDEANRRLRGEEHVVGVESDELRDRLLAGFRYVLVDEYQDIDGRQYELIRHVAKRREQAEDADTRASILAVGDDDQSIYGWRDANVEFLRRFEDDFGAERRYLVENYRSTKHIIDASNALIRHNADRMKTAHPIRVNDARASDAPGGGWGERDTLTSGRVSVLQVADAATQAAAVLAEIERLRGLDPDPDWQDFAVLGRSHAEFGVVRALLESKGVPVRRALRSGMPPLSRIRELRRLLAYVEGLESHDVAVPDLRESLPAICGCDSLWTAIADRVFASVELEFGDEPAPADYLLEALHRALADHTRSHMIGDGVLVSTVHAAKGLEYPHVLVLGGGWDASGTRDEHRRSAAQAEEERRLYYVAITRARRSLTLLERADQPLEYTHLMDGGWLLRRYVRVAEGAPDAVRDVQYTVLGMADLFLDYAGQRADGQRVHAALASAQTGARVELRGRQKSVYVHDSRGRQLARLSVGAACYWLPQLRQVDEVRVLGIWERVRDDSRPGFCDDLRCDRWEVPILEVRHRLGTIS